jgi:hypothetical protein
MKTLFYSFLIIPVAMACGGSEEAETEESSDTSTDNSTTEEVVEEEVENLVTIKENTAGIFQIGQQVPEKLPKELKMRQFLEKDVDDEGNSVEHTHNVVFNSFEDVVELIMEKDAEGHHEHKSIEEMIVLSNYYTTEQGIGVGSSATEFQEAYSDATVWYDKIHDHYYLESVQLPSIQFIIEPKGVAKECTNSRDFSEINFSYLTVDAEIEKIRVL